ncbi:transglycosylase SLT domain-containing protein [Catenovulum sp. SX2]|uniref:transglycosylase SLT domain-containing protein n=1 Tax=Catenovulum sp. SX2 TaxID=3398614 RepID=UPI003F826DE2
MKRSVIFTAILCSTLPSYSHAMDDPFAELESEFKQFREQGSAKEMEEFQRWKDDYLAEYQQFREEHFQRLDDIRDNLISNWGESEISTESKQVEYSDDNQSKTVLDYEKNEIRISVLHDASEKVSSKDLEKFVSAALNNKDDSQTNSQDKIKRPQVKFNQWTSQSVQAEEKEPNVNNTSSSLRELVKGKSIEQLTQSAKKDEKPLTVVSNPDKLYKQEAALIEEQSKAQEIQVERMVDVQNMAKNQELSAAEEEKVESRIQQEKKKIEQEKLERLAKLKEKTKQIASNSNNRAELTNKKITTFTIPLGKQRESKLAQPFIQPVLSQAKRWDIDPSLMLAIMHTESHFNPQAQSHIPAYGLMQIVPSTASVDVNRFLFKKDDSMSKDELFTPDKNIETGAAYVHILNSRYLKAIEDPQSRLYCVIAAYNTGAGNVAKTFNSDKSRNIRKAAVVINSLTPDQVYQKLLSSLPYDETRNYVKKVTSRQDLYTELDKI